MDDWALQMTKKLQDGQLVNSGQVIPGIDVSNIPDTMVDGQRTNMTTQISPRFLTQVINRIKNGWNGTTPKY